MWIPSKDKLRKVRLQSQGEDVETPWAEDLGPVGGHPGARRVRIGNVPFLHAKPTYGDVLVVVPDPDDGMLTWDSNGVPFDELSVKQRRVVMHGLPDEWIEVRIGGGKSKTPATGKPALR